ncbi:DNA cytosine methyltransferase [Streptomyces sp. NPDC006655]|uniref:DNA cytosine methyltransferase n=1 Tax=Streptomyces sp. NPDC006655 TaxID=3156898 RepID=UPI003453B46F
MTDPTDIRRALGGPPTIVALCAGYGGLETAIRAGIGGQVAAYAENDPYAAAVFAAHHPQAPNLGDITAVDWHTVRELYRPNVVAAGFPCRNISNAGRKDGINGQWSRVWKNVAQAVGVLRPRYVFLENVAAIRSRGRGLDVVAADLAALGYDARWTCLRAGDPEVGAPHPRDRWFAVAHPADADPDHLGRHWRPRNIAEPQGRDEPAHRRHETAPTHRLSLLPTPAARDWKSGASNLLDRNARPLNEFVVNLLPTPRAAADRTSRRAAVGWHSRSAPSLEQAIEISGGILPRELRTWSEAPRSWQPERLDQEWGKYEAAIRRWERVLGRPAPLPTEPGTRGNRRLAPLFVEWMMGLPAGWVTAVPGIPRTEQLKILGNGVVWQQAHHAYGLLVGAALSRLTTSGLEVAA